MNLPCSASSGSKRPVRPGTRCISYFPAGMRSSPSPRCRPRSSSSSIDRTETSAITARPGSAEAPFALFGESWLIDPVRQEVDHPIGCPLRIHVGHRTKEHTDSLAVDHRESLSANDAVHAPVELCRTELWARSLHER